MHIDPEKLKQFIEEIGGESCEAGISNVELMSEVLEDHAQSMLWSSLDEAAGASLSTHNFRCFLDHRKSLRAEGHSWEDDAELILREVIGAMSRGR